MAIKDDEVVLSSSVVDRDAPVEFTLNYEVQLDDLVDACKISPARRRRRSRVTWRVMAWVLLSWIGVIDLRRGGAPSWLYGMNGVTWFIALINGLLIWSLSPRKMAKRAWRQTPTLHGHARDLVGGDGVTRTLPVGTRIYRPWTVFAEVEETERAFHLIDDRDRTVTLPKRGLADSSLVPVMRDFLYGSVDQRPGLCA